MYRVSRSPALPPCQLTRDFGSTMMKRECSGLAPEPHVAVVELCEDDEFLVIGSDGLFEVFGNHKQLVRVVKDMLRTTGSVDETARNLVRDTIKSPMSNDNVSVVIIVFNQYGVVTGHAGAGGGWRGFATACKPVLPAPEGMHAPPCPLPPHEEVPELAPHQALSSALSQVMEPADEDHDDSETMAHTPMIGMVPKLHGKPVLNHHLLQLEGGHHGPGSAGKHAPHHHAPSPLRTVVLAAGSPSKDDKENAVSIASGVGVGVGLAVEAKHDGQSGPASPTAVPLAGDVKSPGATVGAGDGLRPSGSVHSELMGTGAADRCGSTVGSGGSSVLSDDGEPVTLDTVDVGVTVTAA